jgi:hypothetical protein
MPSDVFAKRGALMVEDGFVSWHDEFGFDGVGAGAGAVGDVGDPGTIGVGAVGPLFRQNKPKDKNLRTGRQKNFTRNADTAAVLVPVVRSDDCVAAVGVILPLNKYSGFLDDINCHCESCPRAGIKPCIELAGVVPGRKSIIKSSLITGRQFELILSL